MPAAARQVFWQRTQRLTLGLLLVWLAMNLLVPWFARDLQAWQTFSFPVGYWLAAQGLVLFYLLIIVVYVVVMDRLEARYLANAPEDAAAADDNPPGPA